MHSFDDDSELTGLDALTEAVKSRILDRVLADLKENLALGSRASGYTKSDSGVYGKYQKADVELAEILEAVRHQMDVILAEYKCSSPEQTAGLKPRKSAE